MELYQLRYFVAVAETANFTKAASRSNVSQPSLSQQIINLEEEVGQKLFHRLGRSVALTEAGKVLLEHARRILTEADSALRELKEDAAKGFRVSVGAIPTIAHFFFPAIAAHVRANEVPLDVTTYEDFRSDIVRAVLEGQIDLGIVAQPIIEPQLLTTKLFTEPLLLAIGVNHPLATKETVTVSDLSEHDFILLGDASSLTAQVRQMSGDHAFEPRIAHRCAQLATVKSLTAMNLGISILPLSARTPNDPVGLIYRKFSGANPVREIVLIRHYRRHLGRGAQLFTEAAHAVVGPTDSTVSVPPFAKR
jgi:LysR family transcriptional regulator, hydrogen peroxide-inducible genes activator